MSPIWETQLRKGDPLKREVGISKHACAAKGPVASWVRVEASLSQGREAIFSLYK